MLEHNSGRQSFPIETHEVDVCVVGGGMAGLCAAVAAARHGARTVLMQDRPVLGGNASSETRVHVCGADRHNQVKNMRETGILEELRLENLYRNHQRSFSVWDTVLYETAMLQPGLTLLLNCSCLDAAMDGPRIESVTGWQLTTQTLHRVSAGMFIDCSGDAILAPLTGAAWRMGREAGREYGESLAPETPDERTMGMTCLFQTRRHDSPQPFEPPSWAYTFDESDLPYGARGHGWWEMGYWWIELGGEEHTIRDTERIKHELLRTAYGVWDHIKNGGDHGAENWALEWIQFIPGKRESRRYIGEHVMTQHDIESGGRFEDTVAYGGWTMDDHPPAGFRGAKLGHPAAVMTQCRSPYGIAYRSLYSRNVPNLLFAGRCASCTHVAMSSTRVMGTGSSMGQAAGTAAALAAKLGVEPSGLLDHMSVLQQALLADDCYVPGLVREFSDLTRTADLTASQGDPEPVRDGVSRPVAGDPHSWTCRVGDHVEYSFDGPRRLREVALVLDSALEKNVQMSYHQRDDQLTAPPSELPRALRVEALRSGEWRTCADVAHNRQRLVRVPVDIEAESVRLSIDGTWGDDETRVFSFSVE